MNDREAQKQIKQLVEECGGIEIVIDQINKMNDVMPTQTLADTSNIQIPEPQHCTDESSGSLHSSSKSLAIEPENAVAGPPPPPPLPDFSAVHENIENIAPKVETRTEAAPVVINPPNKSNLLDQIHKGIALKKLDKDTIEADELAKSQNLNPMLMHLQNRLNAMRLNVADEADGEDSGEESDSWEG
ncbi:hypothetical protein RF11_06269 [Thelohanellus kitauei]|uniref:WH2 domain-containing protein n=1 Tax=Thelohanellus kitauei TaxID=669202 RepID=A0A0C2IDD7_THEKT|nr:hypothetical protein RF11_06269 [Thelohanellus kitauei]